MRRDALVPECPRPSPGASGLASFFHADGARHAELVALLDAGRIRPVVGRTAPWTELPDELGAPGPREASGRTVLRWRVQRGEDEGQRVDGADPGVVVAGGALGVEPVVGDPLVQRSERDLQLHAGEVRAEAAVEAAGERDVAVFGPLEVDRSGRESGGSRLAAAQHTLSSSPARICSPPISKSAVACRLPADRRLHPHELLDRRRGSPTDGHDDPPRASGWRASQSTMHDSDDATVSRPASTRRKMMSITSSRVQGVAADLGGEEAADQVVAGLAGGLTPVELGVQVLDDLGPALGRCSSSVGRMMPSLTHIRNGTSSSGSPSGSGRSGSAAARRTP